MAAVQAVLKGGRHRIRDAAHDGSASGNGLEFVGGKRVLCQAGGERLGRANCHCHLSSVAVIPRNTERDVLVRKTPGSENPGAVL